MNRTPPRPSYSFSSSNSAFSSNPNAPQHPAPRFDHEKLDVYQLELSFLAWVTPILHEVKSTAAGFHREICDQLDRASLSALLNTAEGNGKRQGKQRAKFFDDARGSAVECAACLDALVVKKLISADQIGEGKTMLLRIVGMLTKLVERFDQMGAAGSRTARVESGKREFSEDENEQEDEEGRKL